jgi:hypothetical protein
MLSPRKEGGRLHLYVAKPMSRNGHFSRRRTAARETLHNAARVPEEPNPVKLVEPIYVDHQAAAVWLSLFTPGDGTRIDRMPEVVETYSSWTAEANGAALESCAEVDNPPLVWNPIYWRLVARCVTTRRLTGFACTL